MPPVGLEPTHTRLKGGRSDQLSYGGHSTLVACGVRFDRFRRAGPSAALRGGTPAVAVAAAHLAAGDLGVDSREARLAPRQGGDAGALLTDVVELEHEEIALVTVDAARSQRGEHMPDVATLGRTEADRGILEPAGRA